MSSTPDMRPDGPKLHPLWIQNYRQRKKFIDLHIYAHPRRQDDDPICAHMVIIGASTPRFHRLIKPLEDSSATIKQLTVPGVSRAGLEIVVDSIYTGTVNGLTDTNVLDVLSASHKLAMCQVKNCCEKYIKEVMKIGFHNVVQILNSLNLTIIDDKTSIYNHLWDTCSNFVIKNLSKMIIETDYSRMSKDIMLKIIQAARSKMLQLTKTSSSSPTDLSSSTFNLLMFVLNWLLVRDADRMVHVSEIVEALPVQQINSKVLERVMDKFRGHKNESKLNKIIGKVLLVRGARSGSSTYSVPSSSASPSLSNKIPKSCLKVATPDLVTLPTTTTTTPHRPSVSLKNTHSGVNNGGRGVKRPSKPGDIVEVTPRPKTKKEKSSPDSDTPSTSPQTFTSTAADKNGSSVQVDSPDNFDEDDDIGAIKIKEDDDCTFFYLSGNELSSRKLRSFSFRDKQVKDVSFYFISEYVNNSLVYHDRKVYVLGGQKESNNAGTDVHIYYMDRKAWTTGPSMVEGRCEFSAVYLDGYIYVAGGDQYTQTGPRKRGQKIKGSWDGINCVERLKVSSTQSDSQTVDWQVMDYMHCTRHNFGFEVLGKKLYAVGGNSAKEGKSKMKASNTVECLDPNVVVKEEGKNIYGQWTMKASMCRPRIGHCLIAARGLLYVFGGGSDYNGNIEMDPTKTRSVEIYDPEKDVWTPGPSMNKKRKYFGAFLHGKFIYAVGGDADKDGPTIERLDLDANEWVIVADSTTFNDPEAHFWSVALQA